MGPFDGVRTLFGAQEGIDSYPGSLSPGAMSIAADPLAPITEGVSGTGRYLDQERVCNRAAATTAAFTANPANIAVAC